MPGQQFRDEHRPRLGGAKPIGAAQRLDSWLFHCQPRFLQWLYQPRHRHGQPRFLQLVSICGARNPGNVPARQEEITNCPRQRPEHSIITSWRSSRNRNSSCKSACKVQSKSKWSSDYGATDTVIAPFTPRKNLPCHKSLLCTPRPKRPGGKRPSCPRGTVP